MSQKYKLTADTDDDGVFASIKRHLKTAALLIILPIIIILILEVISISAEIRAKAVADNNQRVAILTRAAQPTRTPLPTMTPLPTLTAPFTTFAKGSTNLRSSPGLWYKAVGKIEAGQPITLIGRTEAFDWFQVENGAWIASTWVPEPFPILTITWYE